VTKRVLCDLHATIGRQTEADSGNDEKRLFSTSKYMKAFAKSRMWENHKYGSVRAFIINKLRNKE